MALVLSVLEQGMIYAIMALGVYITYKILDFPDLTVDGSFPLGAAITAVMITKGVHPLITLVVSFAAGAVVGVLTGVIHVKLKVRDLLSGIIMMTALYTVNLRIAGRAISNGLVTLSGCIYTQQQRYFDVSMGTGTVVIGLASVIIGTSLFKKVTFFRVTTSVVIGSIIYKACVALAISFGLQSTDLKLVTAVLFLIILVVSMDRKKKVKNNA